MATLEIRYGGQTLCNIPIGITIYGHYIKARVSGKENVNLQTGHIWKNGKSPACKNPDLGNAGRGVGTVDSSTEQLLEVIVIPDNATEITFNDFITLEHILVEWLSL